MWKNGEKTGAEICWNADARKIWEWDHLAGGIGVWTQYWSNGTRKLRSQWKNDRGDGESIAWNKAGEVTARHQFADGEMVK